MLSRNEGGNPSQIIIANNSLINVSMTPGGGGVSSSPVTIGRAGEAPVVTYSDIIVSGNTVSLPGGAAIFAESVSNLTVRKNVFKSPCEISAGLPKQGSESTTQQAVYLSHTDGARVDSNVLVDESASCKEDPVTRAAMLGLGPLTRSVTLDGKALPPTPVSLERRSTSVASTSLPRGVLDVTAPPHSVDNSGATDVTQQLRVAIKAAFAGNEVVFLPVGRYLISDTIDIAQPCDMFQNRGDGGINIVPCRFRPNVVIGSPEALPGRRPTLVLAAHAPGFANASAPKNIGVFCQTYGIFTLIVTH